MMMQTPCRFLFPFAYEKKLPNVTTDTDYSCDPADHESQFTPLVQAYCLGEKYDSPGFKNAVIDAIVSETTIRDREGHPWFPSGSAIAVLYEGTCKGSPARRLMVDQFVLEMDGSNVFEDNSLPLEFLRELTAKLLDRVRLTDGHTSGMRSAERWLSYLCQYHEHNTGDVCA